MKWPFRRREQDHRTLRETRRLRLAPGDTLVLLFDQRLSTDHKARIAANLKSHFEDNLILVLDEGTDVAVLDRSQLADVVSGQIGGRISSRKLGAAGY